MTIEVHASTAGNDATGAGTAALPFRTINKAARELARRMGSGLAKRGTILAAPGTYEEAVLLSSGMSLMRTDRQRQVTCDTKSGKVYARSDPVVLKRPAASSAPGKSSTRPTHPAVLTIEGVGVAVHGVVVDGDLRPQGGVEIRRSRDVSLTNCKVTRCRTRVTYQGGTGSGTQKDPFRGGAVGNLEQAKGAGLLVFDSDKVRVVGCHFVDNRTDSRLARRYPDSMIDKGLEQAKRDPRWGLAPERLKRKALEAAERARRALTPVYTHGGHVHVRRRVMTEAQLRRELNAGASISVRISGCVLERGESGGRGGAICLGYRAYRIMIVDCLVRHNKAGIDGGGIAISEGTRKPTRATNRILSCRVLHNEAADDGGGVYLTSRAQTEISGCTISSNRARNNGGGVRATFGSSTTLERCVIQANASNIDAKSNLLMNRNGGGGVAGRNCTLRLRSCTVSNNRVHGFAGGAVYFLAADDSPEAKVVHKAMGVPTVREMLLQDYKFHTALLELTGCTLQQNDTSGTTCYEAVCIAPNVGFAAGGAGGAIYALGSSLSGLKTEVRLTSNSLGQNRAGHGETKKRAEVVLVRLDLARLQRNTIAAHPKNAFDYSFLGGTVPVPWPTGAKVHFEKP